MGRLLPFVVSSGRVLGGRGKKEGSKTVWESFSSTAELISCGSRAPVEAKEVHMLSSSRRFASASSSSQLRSLSGAFPQLSTIPPSTATSLRSDGDSKASISSFYGDAALQPQRRHGGNAGALLGLGSSLTLAPSSTFANYLPTQSRSLFWSSKPPPPASPSPPEVSSPDVLATGLDSTTTVVETKSVLTSVTATVEQLVEQLKPEKVNAVVTQATDWVHGNVEKLPPPVQDFINPSNPYLQEAGIFALFLGAWTLFPRYLRRLHRGITDQSTRLQDLRVGNKQVIKAVPYEHSVFSAVEDPARFLISLVAFTHLAVSVAPTSDVTVFLTQAWSGSLALSFTWFLYRWKTNVLGRLLSSKEMDITERERLRSFDNVSTVGLVLLGILSVAESSGFAVQSILTVGGIGGVATAFAARDVIGNVLSGAMLYFYQPFSIGDTILAGNVKGKVIDVGIHSTQLLNSDKHPVSVPNSFFSSQVIVNESRTKHRGFSTVIPLLLDDIEKVPTITRQVRGMLVNHPKVFTEEEHPRAYLSRVTTTHAEVTITCNVQRMTKDEFFLAEEDILCSVARIMSEVKGTIGENSPWPPPTKQAFDIGRPTLGPELDSPKF